MEQATQNVAKSKQHPLHPMFTHFPMGLCSISVLWDIIGLWTGKALWFNLSFWSMTAGVAIGLVAAVVGFIDYIRIPNGHPAERTALVHISVVVVALMLFGGSILVRLGNTVPTGGRLGPAVALSWIGFLCLVVGGWFGGHLVYHFGVGVEAKSSTQTAPRSEAK